VLLLATAISGPDVRAQARPGGVPGVHLNQRTWIDLKITPANAEPAESGSPDLLLVRVDPQRGGRTEFTLAWPDPGSRTLLRLRAAQAVSASDLRHAVDLDVELTLPSGGAVRAQRRIELDDRATALFEVYRHEERPLTLVIEAEASQEMVISRYAQVGKPVRFLLEIQRVERGKVVSLETDRLQAFEGHDVSYSFRLGSDPDAEAARLRLRPLRVGDEIVEIEIETDGRLPGPDGLLVIGRRERWVASRGTTSTLAFESGEPPTGYRFLVTPEF
jgi:hypothetical protein